MAGTTYKVNADLNLRSNATRELARISAALGLLDTRIRRSHLAANALATRLGNLGTARMAQGLRTAATSMDSLGRSTRDTATAMSRLRPGIGATGAALNNMAQASTAATHATQGLNRSLGGQGRVLGRIATVAQHAASAMRALAAVPPPHAIPAPPGGWGRRQNGPQGAGNRLWRRITDRAETSLLPTPREAARGLGYMLAQGGSLQTESVIAREQLGPENAQYFDRLRRRAEETANLVPGTTPAGNLRAGMELRTSIPDREQVINLLPTFQEMAQSIALLDARRGGGEDRAEGAAGHIARFLNLRGSIVSRADQNKTDLERFQREAELLSRNFIALRGLQPREWVNFQQQARSAGQNLSEDAMFGGFAASGIQAMRGHRFGTGLAAFTRQFQTGIMTKAQAQVLSELGLITRDAKSARVPRSELESMRSRGELTDDEFESLSQGNAQRFSRRNMLFADLVASPEQWQEMVRKHLQGRRFRGAPLDMNDPRTLDTLAQAMGGTQVAQGFLSWLFDAVGRRADIQAVRDVQEGAGGRIVRDSFAGGMANLTGSFNTFLQALGESQEVVKLLNDWAQGFKDMAATLRDNPSLVSAAARELREFTQGIRDVAAAVSNATAILRFVHHVLSSDPATLGREAGASLRQMLPGVTPPGAPAAGSSGAAAPPSIQGVPTAPSLVPIPGAGTQRGLLSPGIHLQNFDVTRPPSQAQPQPIVLMLDGREVGRGVMPWLGREASGPLQGTARFDGLRAMPSQEGLSV